MGERNYKMWNWTLDLIFYWLFNNAVSTGSSKKNAGIIKTYHSKTVKHIKMIQVLKCGERT
jgi:hypothetical protein